MKGAGHCVHVSPGWRNERVNGVERRNGGVNERRMVTSTAMIQVQCTNTNDPDAIGQSLLSDNPGSFARVNSLRPSFDWPCGFAGNQSLIFLAPKSPLRRWTNVWGSPGSASKQSRPGTTRDVFREIRAKQLKLPEFKSHCLAGRRRFWNCYSHLFPVLCVHGHSMT